MSAISKIIRKMYADMTREEIKQTKKEMIFDFAFGIAFIAIMCAIVALMLLVGGYVC